MFSTGKWGNFTDFSQYFQFFRAFFYVFFTIFWNLPVWMFISTIKMKLAEIISLFFSGVPLKSKFGKIQNGAISLFEKYTPVFRIFLTISIFKPFLTLLQLYMGSNNFRNEIKRFWKFPVWNRQFCIFALLSNFTGQFR